MSAQNHPRSDQRMKIALEDINTDQYDVREEVDEEHVQQIAESLEEDGQWNPVIVCPSENGSYDLIAGHTRYRAASEIGWSELEAIVKDIDDQEANELALKTNLKRKGMSKIEEGKTINRILEEHSLTQGELADQLGKSRRWVNERVKVALELDPKVKGLVQEGELSYNIARIVTQVDEERQLEFAELLIERDITQAAEASKLKNRFENDTIYTIGYQERDFDRLITDLNEHDIDVLIDVRKSAESTYKPEFNKEVLSDRLEDTAIDYRHEPELGVDYLIRAPYKDQAIDNGCFGNWYRWWVEKESSVDLESFVRDLEGEGRPALMCIERHAEPDGDQEIYCHRHHLAEMIRDYEEQGRRFFPNRIDV